MIKTIIRSIRSTEPHTKFYRSLVPQGRLLDLGCGSGDKGKAIKSLHPEMEIHGVDIIPETLVPGFYQYQKVDLDKGILPYPDEYFDGIMFWHVIEHLKYPMQLGSEINRVMKKGARIYVETPNWTTILVPSFGFHREQHVGPFNFFDDPTHLKPWSKHSLFEFLSQSCHLSVERISTYRYWFKMPFDLLLVFWGCIRGNRRTVLGSFWNLYGWCIYGIGTKK